MTFGSVTLNDGNKIPAIAFGTGSVNKGKDITNYVLQAIDVGFTHLDTAAFYGNEESVGKALEQSEESRSNFFITTKYPQGDVTSQLKNSLSKIGVKQVDLYLIHSPRFVNDMAKTWGAFEQAKKDGLAKSIGVSNFDVNDLERVIQVANIKPAIDQINFDTYKYAENKSILEFAALHNIVVEGYNCLSPLKNPGGPVDKPVSAAAKRLCASSTQVILSWVRSKGVVIVTTSSTKEHLEEYLEVADLPPLTEDEIKAIDNAALKGYSLCQRIKSRLPQHPLPYVVGSCLASLLLISRYCRP